MDLKDNIVLITGASRGIGQAFAKRYAQEGYGLILVARSSEELQQLAQELQTQHKIFVKCISLDLSLENAVEKLMEQCVELLPRIEILINNAGFGLVAKFTSMPYEELQAMLRVNIEVVTKLCYRMLPYMITRGGGKILNVSSTAAYTPGPYMALYYASKAFVSSLSQSLYDEYKTDKVTVSALCPGVTKTGFQERANMEKSLLVSGKIPMMTAEQVAEAGYQGLKNNKRVIVSGFFNKLSVLVMWLTPNFIVAKVIAKLNRPKNQAS